MMNARRARAVAFGSIGLGLIVGACSGDQIADNGLAGGGNTTAPGCGPGSGPGGNGAGGSRGASSSASFMTSAGPGSGGSGGEDTCAQDEAEATIINQPVDIIFVIDNSGSMSAEIEDVELQINQNFAAIINAADPPIDYRVVMVSEFGEYNDNAICIAAPLGGVPEDPNNLGHCLGPPAAPVNTANFFHHAPNVNNPGVSRHNAL